MCRKSQESEHRAQRGFVHPPQQHGLLGLDPISARLVSPYLLFMQIRRLHRASDRRAVKVNSSASHGLRSGVNDMMYLMRLVLQSMINKSL